MKSSGTIFSLLGIKKNQIIAIVGAGGKTTLASLLLKEAENKGYKALLAPTASIGKWQSQGTVVLDENGPETKENQNSEDCEKTALNAESGPETAKKKLENGEIVTYIREIDGEKLRGISGEKLCALADCIKPHIIICEADGARGLDFKAPRAHEFLLPQCTDKVIVCCALSSFGKVPDSIFVHSLDQVLSFMDGRDKGLISPGLFSRIALSSRGYGTVEKSEIFLYLGKVDRGGGSQKAHEIAREILSVCEKSEEKKGIGGILWCEPSAVAPLNFHLFRK